MKYTPGPWEFGRPERDGFDRIRGHYTEPERFLVAVVGEGNEMDGSDNIIVEGPNQKANAAIIAAAPDMLDALKQCRVILNAHGIPYEHYVDLAIAKAEGRNGKT